MSNPVERWRSEAGAAWLYRRLAEQAHDPHMRVLFASLAEAGDRQAAILAASLPGGPPALRPGWRLRIAAALAGRFGLRATRPVLAALKVRGLSALEAPAATPGAAPHTMPRSVGDFAGEHRAAGAGSLRAAVFGASDGLVSNTCLILGMAGASPEPRTVILTGVAGLLAGAFSMAAGEYVSVRSQRELLEHQIAQEREELERYPDEEAEELALILASRGAPIAQAREVAQAMVADPERALHTLAREELGVDPDSLGSAAGAALSSFAAFAVGASWPLLAYALAPAGLALLVAAVASGCALFGLGAVLSLFSGRSAWAGGARMLVIGAAAGAATWGIGRLIGVAV